MRYSTWFYGIAGASFLVNVWLFHSLHSFRSSTISEICVKPSILCTSTEVDGTWKHTGDHSCGKFCIEKIGRDRRPYHFNNLKRDGNGGLMVESTYKRRKATRWGTDQAVIKFVNAEKKEGRGKGDILGISGSNYFDLFDYVSSTFTTADYPQVTCENMPYLDNIFDYIICNQVLEHVSKPWLCVDEFHRILKEGGHVIIIVPSIYQEHRWPKDNWRILKDGMDVLLSGFSNVTVGSFGNSNLLNHMIKYPEDRYSTQMMKIAYDAYRQNKNLDKGNAYYTSVYGFGRK